MWHLAFIGQLGGTGSGSTALPHVSTFVSRKFEMFKLMRCKVLIL